MTVQEFLNIADQCDKKTIAVVRNDDKFSGIYKLPLDGVSEKTLELSDVTHYNGIYINNFQQYSIPLDTINRLYIE